mgnify:CR=1 FL=1
MGQRIRTGALTGIEGLAVTAEVDLSRGLPGFHLVGLPGAEVRESRDRVMAALRNAGTRIPPGRITVNLAPAGIRKAGASYDLAIAVGMVPQLVLGGSGSEFREPMAVVHYLAALSGALPLKNLFASLEDMARAFNPFALGRGNAEVVRRMIDAGIRVIQYREKEKSAADKLAECRALRFRQVDINRNRCCQY